MSREFLIQSRTACGVCPKLGPLFPYTIGEKSSQRTPRDYWLWSRGFWSTPPQLEVAAVYVVSFSFKLLILFSFNFVLDR